ncbi:MAG: hypothetical protein M1487_01030 [Actinobacteria bacterium]|nr:hypothetical protein [Actinomycetota bacterium]
MNELTEVACRVVVAVACVPVPASDQAEPVKLAVVSGTVARKYTLPPVNTDFKVAPGVVKVSGVAAAQAGSVPVPVIAGAVST